LEAKKAAVHIAKAVASTHAAYGAAKTAFNAASEKLKGFKQAWENAMKAED
jgi:hypothetical protein